jgi:hypothetical protein
VARNTVKKQVIFLPYPVIQKEHFSALSKIHMHLAVEVPEYEIIYTAPILFLEIVGKLYNTLILTPP